MAKKLDPEEVLQSWCDRDLSAAAEASELMPAFEVDEIVEELREVLASGHSFLLGGEAGVGKTAILHEVVRREVGDQNRERRRFVQISIRHRASTLNNARSQIGPEMHKLVQAILELGPSVIPVFRDFDYVDTFDLEPQILSLLYRFPGSIMAEGRRGAIDAMLESAGELEQHVL